MAGAGGPWPSPSSSSSSELAASGMFVPSRTAATVLCCICGVAMVPNPANTCVRCLRARVDITEGLPRHAVAVYCPECSSYLHPPRTWVRAAPESKELLAFCLRRLRGPLSRRVRLVHAEFLFTEPHSKRLLLRLRVQREVDAAGGAILEQPHVVEFVVHDRLCEGCSRAQANPDQWTAAVQLRQHVAHRRTFLYLEQLLLRHGAAARALRIAAAERGLDFFFASRSHAARLVDFVSGVAPVRSRSDKQLVSHDPKSSLYNYKHTFSVEIAPVCREDLVCLPPKAAHALGNLGPLVLCVRVTASLALLDPLTLRVAFLDAAQYWRAPFRALLTSRQLVEYVVLDVEPDDDPDLAADAGSRYQLAHAQVARVSDFGRNDNIFTVRTHLGRLLSPGDYALGYDLYAANTNDLDVDGRKGLVLPDAILVKKSYEEQRRRGKQQRPWKLKSLAVDADASAGAKGGRGDEEKRSDEYEEFLRDLEENPEMRFNVSLYRNKDYQPSEMAASSAADGDDIPSVPLDELLADLELSDDDNEEEESGDDGGGGSMEE
ncbi:60S ribosomal export protein NMD3 [Ananas comosus]|uniref:60S ribosomal export protein NMD3 n=1 Tax=Ananas comosus TaxID=4615 RepID=A0A199UZH0_ANACO|nr:60S ribosomal export protein NMD3 [Ananas comosus]